jgi:hypothetical protein
VLQAQCLSFRFDKLIFMSKAPDTILQLARRAPLGSAQVAFPHTLPALHVRHPSFAKSGCAYFRLHFIFNGIFNVPLKHI